MHSRNCSTAEAMSFTRHLIRRGLYLVVLGAFAMNVAAAELRSISVSLEEGRYHLTSETLFEVSQDDIYAVLVDYDLFEKFSSAIVESRNIEPGADGRPRFYTRLEGCILLYCMSFVRNGYLLLTPKHDIVAVSDPEESDFNYSRERWQLSGEGDSTLLIYNFEMEPSFWVPPVIGPYYIKRVLKAGGSRAVSRIETLARGEEPVL